VLNNYGTDIIDLYADAKFVNMFDTFIRMTVGDGYSLQLGDGATAGGGEFFGKVGKFEDGYEFDALVLDDEKLPHPQELPLQQRLERFAYLGGDKVGMEAKYVAGNKVF